MKRISKFALFIFFIGIAVFATSEIQRRNPLQALEKEIMRKITLLEKENSALKAEKEKLASQLSQASEEKENLKARLSSEAELNKALGELRRQARRVGMEIQQRVKDDEIGEGNRGIVTKESVNKQ